MESVWVPAGCYPSLTSGPELLPITCLTHMAGRAVSSGFITVRCSNTLENWGDLKERAVAPLWAASPVKGILSEKWKDRSEETGNCNWRKHSHLNLLPWGFKHKRLLLLSSAASYLTVSIPKNTHAYTHIMVWIMVCGHSVVWHSVIRMTCTVVRFPENVLLFVKF